MMRIACTQKVDELSAHGGMLMFSQECVLTTVLCDADERMLTDPFFKSLDGRVSTFLSLHPFVFFFASIF